MSAASTFSTSAQVQTLLDQLRPASAVRVLSASHEKAFPKRDRIDLYRVELQDRTIRQTTTLAVHQLSNERRAKAFPKLAKAAERLAGVEVNRLSIVGEIPAQGLLLYTFPLDPKLTHLADATNPSSVAAKLGVADPVDVEVIRYVPSRRCQLRWASASQVLYAKLYHDGRGEEVFHAMQRLHKGMTASGVAGAGTPAPVAYLSEWNALLQQAAPGVTLHSLCCSGQADAAAFAFAGRALAVMHGVGGEVTRKHTAQDELLVADHWVSLAEQQSGFQELRADLMKLRGVATGGTSLPTVVHRDCYDRQFLVDESRVAIIDLDELAFGEPELDLANFLAHVELRAMQGTVARHSARRFRAAFLGAYEACCSQRPVARRFHFYVATSLIRLAALYSLRPGEEAVAHRLFLRAGTAVREAHSSSRDALWS